jgi:hypothetical protein
MASVTTHLTVPGGGGGGTAIRDAIVDKAKALKVRRCKLKHLLKARGASA